MTTKHVLSAEFEEHLAFSGTWLAATRGSNVLHCFALNVAPTCNYHRIHWENKVPGWFMLHIFPKPELKPSKPPKLNHQPESPHFQRRSEVLYMGAVESTAQAGEVIPLCSRTTRILGTGDWLLSSDHSSPGWAPACLRSMGVLPLLPAQLKFAFRNWQRLEVCSWEGSTQVHDGWRPCSAWSPEVGTLWGSRGVPLSLDAPEWTGQSQVQELQFHLGVQWPLWLHTQQQGWLLISKYFHIFSRRISSFALSPSHQPLFPSHKHNDLMAKMMHL